MINESLVVMVGGASSRMKKSLEVTKLDESTKAIAQKQHKSLIPLGKQGKPLLHYLIANASEAGYNHVYLITSEQNEGFKDLVGTNDQNNSYQGILVHFAIQKIHKGRQKPLGTADALQQCLGQYPELKKKTFTVCNGDNLYGTEALADLRKARKTANALISYASSGLQFSQERISRFALMQISSEGFLEKIVEKPDAQNLDKYRDTEGELRVSMNVFSFFGNDIYPHLVNCPIHPERGEKELPEAVRNMVAHHPKSVICFPRSEHIPDLTSAQDIGLFK
ncbi:MULTISPECIES: sugar phosphate nucleotidyltransferase [Flavobacteriaceae]|uniref:sugar phosphate nucleotidyltransferase n=1 Tax=Flavobacteriaceae TaxID=49546 RepID=UPI0014911311|nr:MULTISPECIES: sugar phosphate nucleotidyltransferase [Allomuricauda]MDC6366030.1 sugar phosphate nucleotidyltransferase [Muricauda sp. AC10]